MKPFIAVAFAALSLAACTTNAPELQPIPGSITYGGQPHTKLMKSPIGAIVPHSFYTDSGQLVQETYILQPDRSLKLVKRDIIDDWPPNR